MAIAAAGLSAGGLAAAGGLMASRPASGPAVRTAAPGAQWTEIRRPFTLYDLAGTEFSKLPATYGARRRGADGAREDVMSFGRLGPGEAYLLVSLLRAGAADDGGTAGRRATGSPTDWRGSPTHGA